MGFLAELKTLKFDSEQEARSVLEEVKRTQTYTFECEADARQALETAVDEMAALLSDASLQEERVSAVY